MSLGVSCWPATNDSNQRVSIQPGTKAGPAAATSKHHGDRDRSVKVLRAVLCARLPITLLIARIACLCCSAFFVCFVVVVFCRVGCVLQFVFSVFCFVLQGWLCAVVFFAELVVCCGVFCRVGCVMQYVLQGWLCAVVCFAELVVRCSDVVFCRVGCVL